MERVLHEGKEFFPSFANKTAESPRFRLCDECVLDYIISRQLTVCYNYLMSMNSRGSTSIYNHILLYSVAGGTSEKQSAHLHWKMVFSLCQDRDLLQTGLLESWTSPNMNGVLFYAG
ncbi:MAG: hypothetical protein GX887_04180 [Firmicutes bacterium]|nr:hypothetical protein [Bacillota bacterium]